MENWKVKSDEARRNLRYLLSEVEDGRHVTITRWNIPTAVMVSVDWYEQAQRALTNGKEKP